MICLGMIDQWRLMMVRSSLDKHHDKDHCVLIAWPFYGGEEVIYDQVRGTRLNIQVMVSWSIYSRRM